MVVCVPGWGVGPAGTDEAGDQDGLFLQGSRAQQLHIENGTEEARDEEQDEGHRPTAFAVGLFRGYLTSSRRRGQLGD